MHKKYFLGIKLFLLNFQVFFCLPQILIISSHYQHTQNVFWTILIRSSVLSKKKQNYSAGFENTEQKVQKLSVFERTDYLSCFSQQLFSTNRLFFNHSYRPPRSCKNRVLIFCTFYSVFPKRLSLPETNQHVYLSMGIK